MPPIKICPACGIHAPIVATVCINCSHIYRTKPTDLQEMGQAQETRSAYFPSPSVAEPQRLQRRRLPKQYRAKAFLVLMFLVLLIAALIITLYHLQHQN